MLLEALIAILIFAPVMLPIEWLTQGPVPRDGADLCTDPLRAFAR